MNTNLDHPRMEGEPRPSDRRSVLIADDNPFFLEALMITLKMDKRLEIAGRAQHGREAVEMASSLHPDVVLMDLDMPVLDGIEATRGVLEASPTTRVVVLTASSSSDDERRARDAGAHAYLRKGCPAADLFDAILAMPPKAIPNRRRERSVPFLRLGFRSQIDIHLDRKESPSGVSFQRPLVTPHSPLRPDPARQPARLRVLLADDDDLFVEALTVTLELDGRLDLVGRARDGREAIELAAALHPDVVLMDVNMPVLDGVEATREVRQLSPATRIVVVTASTSADDERRASAAGASAYVRKGGHAAELFDAVFSATTEERSAGRRERPVSPRAQPSPALGAATSRALRAWL